MPRKIPLPRSWNHQLKSRFFVASTDTGIATRPGRPLPGPDLVLLEQHLSQRTWINSSNEFVPDLS